MPARSARQRVLPPTRNVNAERSQNDAVQMVARIEHLLSSTPDKAQYLKALATLRGWQVDPTLDPAAREKARKVLWRFQPNGWDEV